VRVKKDNEIRDILNDKHVTTKTNKNILEPLRNALFSIAYIDTIYVDLSQ